MKNVQILEKSGSFWVFSSIMNDFLLFHSKKGALKTRVFGAQTALSLAFKRGVYTPLFFKKLHFLAFFGKFAKIPRKCRWSGGGDPRFLGFFWKNQGGPPGKVKNRTFSSHISVRFFWPAKNTPPFWGGFWGGGQKIAQNLDFCLFSTCFTRKQAKNWVFKQFFIKNAIFYWFC